MNTMITKVMTNKLVKRLLGPNTNTMLVDVCQSDIVREVLSDVLKGYIFKHPGYHQLVVYLGATRASLFKDVELYGVVSCKSSEAIYMTQQQRDRLRTAIIDAYLPPTPSTPPPVVETTRVVTLEVEDEELLFEYLEEGAVSRVMYFRGELYAMTQSLGQGRIVDTEKLSTYLKEYLHYHLDKVGQAVVEGRYKIGDLTLDYNNNLFSRV